MTDKDPKDMTVSELLRKAGNGYEGANGTVMMNLIDLMGLSRKIRHSECLYALADKIDAELAKARKSGFDDFKLADWYYSADANGWPKPRDDESLHEYVDRCFIPRPRFEDGEPVQSSDIEEIGALATCRVYMDGSWEFDPDKYEDERNPKPWDVQSGAKSDRIKRPAPEVLGADGLPLNEDDTVYGTGREQHRYTVQVPYSINEVIGQRFCVQCYDHDEGDITWCDPSMLTHERPVLGADGKPIVVGETVYELSDGTAWQVTELHRSEPRISVVSVGDNGVTRGGWFLASEYTHTPPETQERIDDDATMPPAEYCAVRGIDLGDDPDRATATEAMVRDLLRRQRELDKRTGGE